jgi:hypothetical protein
MCTAILTGKYLKYYKAYDFVQSSDVPSKHLAVNKVLLLLKGRIFSNNTA